MGWRPVYRRIATTAVAVILTCWAVTAPAPKVMAERIENDNASAAGSPAFAIDVDPDLIVLPDEDLTFCEANPELCRRFAGR